jgi:hypothetical protein
MAIRLNMKVPVGFDMRTFAVADWRAPKKIGRILRIRALSNPGFFLTLTGRSHFLARFASATPPRDNPDLQGNVASSARRLPWLPHHDVRPTVAQKMHVNLPMDVVTPRDLLAMVIGVAAALPPGDGDP